MKTLRFLLMLAVALVLMLLFRAVGITVCTIGGNDLTPTFIAGDRLLVNRWSYGLRVGGGESGLFSYGRLWRQPVERGDLVAFEHPQTGEIIVCRCTGLPGDTLEVNGETIVVPSLKNCADADYYWMGDVNEYNGKRLSRAKDNPINSQLLGFISEEYIIGRVFVIAYSHDPEAPLWEGWRTDRFFSSL